MLLNLYEQILNALLWNFLNTGQAEIAAEYLQKLEQLQQLNPSERLQQKILETKLFLDNYRYGTTPQQMGENAKKYSEFLVENLHLTPQFDFSKYKSKNKNKNKNSKKLHLKIGFVSGDFKAHPSSYFLLGLLNALQNIQDKKITFDFYFYNNCKQTDEITLKIKALSRAWAEIYELDDQQAANKIYADKIQILFDLSGHTALNRLTMFALKPAPIQITWFGWTHSTGIPAMDYYFVDNFLLPKDKLLEQQITEKPYRFPNLWDVYTPPENTPQVVETPLLKNKFITFGCFHKPNKVSSKTLDLWAKILNSVENSHFIWARTEFIDKTLKDKFKQDFFQRNVDLTKIKLVNISDIPQYFSQYEKIDFLLDTTPFSGMTTTCEALWQGVPILALCGNLITSRLSGSCLQNVNLSDWVCHNENEFIAKAVNFAKQFLQNPQKLNNLRLNLREQVQKSPLCDARLFAENFAIAMQKIWNKFLEN